MSKRQMPPPPRGDFEQAWILWQRWFERITSNTPVTVRVDKTINPSSVPANNTDEQSFTVEGARVGDMITVEKPTGTAGAAIVSARVSALDEVTITFVNVTGSPADPPEETYRFWMLRWNER